MKTKKSLMGFFAIALSSILVFTACDTAVVTPEDTRNDINAVLYAEAPEATSELLFGAPDTFVEGTIETDMMVRENPRSNDKRRDDRVGHRVHPFGKLIRALELTERQKPAVMELLKEHHNCVREALALYREYQKELFAAARAERAEIIAAVKAGEITREEAKEKLRALHMRLREALQNSDIRARVMEMLKACDNQFYRALSELLTDDQKAILERWIASQNDGGSDDGNSGGEDRRPTGGGRG